MGYPQERPQIPMKTTLHMKTRPRPWRRTRPRHDEEHDHEYEDEHDHEKSCTDQQTRPWHEKDEEEKEITSILIKFDSPMNIKSFTDINEETNIQAAVPSYEILLLKFSIDWDTYLFGLFDNVCLWFVSKFIKLLRERNMKH